MAKEEFIMIRCDKEEKQQIKREAEERGKTISDFIRHLLTKERNEMEGGK